MAHLDYLELRVSDLSQEKELYNKFFSNLGKAIGNKKQPINTGCFLKYDFWLIYRMI